jgi:hypothetical protein
MKEVKLYWTKRNYIARKGKDELEISRVFV